MGVLLNGHGHFPVATNRRRSGNTLAYIELLLLVSFSTVSLTASSLEISMDLIIPARDNILGTYSPTIDVSGMVNPQFSSPQIPDSFLTGFRDYFEQSKDLPYPESDILLKCIPTTGSQGLEKAGYCLNNQTFYYVNSGGKLNVLDMKKYFDEECSQWEPSIEHMGIQGCGIRYTSFSIRLQHTYLLVFFRKSYTEAINKTEFLRVIWLTKSFNQIGAYLVELRPDLSQLPFRVFVTNLYPPMPDQRQSAIMIVYQSKEGHLQILQGNYPIMQPRPAFCNPYEPGGYSQISPTVLDCGLTADLDCTFNQVYYYQQSQTMCVGICQINASNPSNLTVNCRGSDGIWLGIPKDDNMTKGQSRSVFRMSYAQEFTLMQFLFYREKIQVITLELGGLLNRKTQVETTTLIDGSYLKSLPPKYDLQQLDVVLLDSKLLFGVQIRSNDTIIAILQSRVTQAVFYTVQPHSTTSPGSTIVYGENILTFGTFPYLWVANQGEINYQIANNQKNETILRKVVVQSEFNKKRMFFTLKVNFHSSFFSCISLIESFSTSIYVNSSQVISIPEYSILGNDVNITNVTLLDGQQTSDYQVSILAQNTLQASLECELDTKPGEYRKCGRGSQGEFKYQDGFLLETWRAPSPAGDGTNSTYIRIFKCLTKQGEVKNFLGYLLLCIQFIDQSPPLPDGITTVGFYPQPKLSAFIILFSGIVSDEGSKSILMVMSKNSSNTIVEEIKGTIFTHQFIAVRHLLPTSSSEEFSLMLIYSVFDDDKPVPKYKLFTKIYLVYAKSLKVKSLKEEKVTEFGEKLEFFCPIGSFSGVNSKIVYIISQCVLPNGRGTDTQLLETKQIGEKLSFVRSFKSLRLLSLTEPMKLCYINNLLITITSSFYRAYIEANLNYNVELPMYSRVKRVLKHFCFEKIGIFAVWLINEFDQSVLYVYKTKYAASRMNSLYRVISVKGDYLEVFCIDKGLLIATRGVGDKISVSLLELDQIGIYAYANAAQGPRSLPTPAKFTYSVTLGNRLASKDLLIDIILDEDIGVTNLGKLEKTTYPNSTFGGLLPALNHKYLLSELFEISGCLINAKLSPAMLGENCTDHFVLDADTFKLRQSSVHRPDDENYLVENIRVEQQINYLQVLVQDSERYRLLVYNLTNGTLSTNPYNFLLDYGGQVPYLYVMDKERKGLLFWEGQEDNSFVLYVHIVNDLSTHNYSQFIQPANSEPIFDGPYDSFRMVGRAHSLSFMVEIKLNFNQIRFMRLEFREDLGAVTVDKIVDIQGIEQYYSIGSDSEVFMLFTTHTGLEGTNLKFLRISRISYLYSIQVLNPPDVWVDLKTARLTCADITVSTHELICALFDQEKYIEVYKLRLSPEGALADNPIQVTKISRLKVPVDFQISSVRLTDSQLIAYATRAIAWEHVNNVIFWYRFSGNSHHLFPLGSLDLSRKGKIDNHDSFVFEFFNNSVIVGNTQLKEPILRMFDLQEAHMTINSLKEVHLKACELEHTKITGSQAYVETVPLSNLLMSQEDAILKLQTVKMVQQADPQASALWLAPLLILWLVSWKRDKQAAALRLQGYVPVTNIEVFSWQQTQTTDQQDQNPNLSKLIEHSIIEHSVQAS